MICDIEVYIWSKCCQQIRKRALLQKKAGAHQMNCVKRRHRGRLLNQTPNFKTKVQKNIEQFFANVTMFEFALGKLYLVTGVEQISFSALGKFSHIDF